MKQRSDLRVLLLQIRDLEKVREEEHCSFADYSGLRRDQIEILNVFDTPHFTPDVLEGYDALFVGGASEASVSQPDVYPFIGSGCALLQAAIELDLPVFASCFGFQLVVVALHGDIHYTPDDFEMGTVPITLAEAAKGDPIFRDVPDGFLAVSVHKEKSLHPPPGCELLAYTDACCHAFRVKGKPFWAFQFHPEVDRARLVERLTIFKDQYAENDAHLEEALSGAQETPVANDLVRKFVDRVLLNQESSYETLS